MKGAPLTHKEEETPSKQSEAGLHVASFGHPQR